MDTNKENTPKKRGRKPLPKGVSERRLALKAVDSQRLNLILDVLYSAEEYKDMSEVDKASMFFSDAIKNKYVEIQTNGELEKHLTSLND